MELAGKILVALGTVALLLAALLLLGIWQDHHSGAWFANLFDNLAYAIAATLAIAGTVGILAGKHWIRKERELREFDEAMKLGNRGLENK